MMSMMGEQVTFSNGEEIKIKNRTKLKTSISKCKTYTMHVCSIWLL